MAADLCGGARRTREIDATRAASIPGIVTAGRAACGERAQRVSIVVKPSTRIDRQSGSASSGMKRKPPGR